MNTQSNTTENPVLARSQKRIEGIFYLLLIPFAALMYRLVTLQALPSSKDSALALKPEIFTRTQILPAQRGQILASDGTALAVTLDEYDICANPRAVTDKPKMARLIFSAIGGDEAAYWKALNKTEKPNREKNYFVRLARRVDAERATKLRKLMGPQPKETRVARRERKDFWSAITFESAPRRHYPLGKFASQLVGFTTGDGKGVDGLEAAWNHKLGGKPGQIISQVDARDRPVPGFVTQSTPAYAGRSVVTTIDPQIQAASDETLSRLVEKYKPNFATAIVMRAKTGDIVAMSTAPLYDLNKRPRNVVELASNRAVNFSYEPGSTFKMITACASVERVPDWQDKKFLVTGAEPVGKHVIHDWTFWSGRNKTAYKSLSDGIRDSSNICMWHFAHLVGAPEMLDYARKFGLGQSVKLGDVTSEKDPGELSRQPGYLSEIDPHDWSSEQLANFSFGQGMTMTPLQLVRVAGTIANRGEMVQPRLIKELRDDQGRVVKTFPMQPTQRVIAPQTALEVTKMMERVTTEGTASKYVWVPGYITAGKTGSAQKADGPRGYSAGRFISSFVGFLPSRKPEFVILVMADEPHGSHWGSEVCGPAYADIAQRAMLTLRLREGTKAPAPAPNLMERPKKMKH